MKKLSLLLIVSFSFLTIADEGRLGREANDYQYSSFGVSFIKAENDGIALNASLALPGPLYAVVERRADGVDLDLETYDKIVNSLRLGIHAGIGDILSSISASGVTVNVKNFVDMYAEFGIKSTSLENDINKFSEDETQANFIAGLRFGDSNAWEGKFFADFSKETDIEISQCPEGEVCTQDISFVLSERTDRKFGAEAVYNISRHSAVNFKFISSDILRSTFELGFRFTF